LRTFEGRDRDICKMLGTNASELERLLGKSRQTISKHIDKDQLFGVDEIIKVASKKITDERERSHVISQAIKKYFPDLLKYTQDLDTQRFAQYYVFGMDIHALIVRNRPVERFLIGLLSDTRKFLLFACAPVKPFVQLGSWLERFQQDRGEDKTASFILIPCKLTELTPVQILAEPWSNDPQLIGFNREEVFVDVSNSDRARQIASALREYGPEAREFGSIAGESKQARAADRLREQLNKSVFQEVPLEKPLVSVNPNR
jgi:hypothetical protein